MSNSSIFKFYQSRKLRYGTCGIEYKLNKYQEWKKVADYHKCDWRQCKRKEKTDNGCLIVAGREWDIDTNDYKPSTGNEVCILDIDDLKLKSSKELMAMAMETCNYIVKTKKGYHYYFKYDDEMSQIMHLHNETYAFDFQSDGAHVFAPPSWYALEDGKKVKYEFQTQPDDNEPINAMSQELKQKLIDLYASSITSKIKVDKKKVKEIAKNEKTIDKDSDNIPQSIIENADPEEIKFVLENINENRSINFEDWINVGLALKSANLDWTLYDMFSKRAEGKKRPDGHLVDYDQSKTYYFYLSMKPRDYTIRSLYFWLKNDNVKAYRELGKIRAKKLYSKILFEKKQPELIEEKKEQQEQNKEEQPKVNYIIDMFDRDTFYKLFDEDTTKLDESSYVSAFEETESFKYFNKYHLWLVIPDMYFELEYEGKAFTMHRIDTIEHVCQEVFIKGEKGKKIRFINLWKDSRLKQSYSRCEFAPNQELNKNILNTFQGFKYENVKLPKLPNSKEDDLSHIQPILDHIKFLSNGSVAFEEYLYNWLASIIQHPERKTEKCIILYSDMEGVGKNSLTDLVGDIFSGYYAKFSNTDKLAGNFNAHLMNKLMIFGDEIKARAKAVADELKNTITQKKINIEFKGKDTIQMNDYSNYMMTTNNEFICQISLSDRRYVLQEMPQEVKSKKYFTEYHECVKKYAGEFFAYLKKRDISNFNIDNIPQTDYAIRNKKECLPAYYKMFIEKPATFINKYDAKMYNMDIKEEDELKEIRYTAEDFYRQAQQFAKDYHLSTNFSRDLVAKKMHKLFNDYYNENKPWKVEKNKTYPLKNFYSFKMDFDISKHMDNFVMKTIESKTEPKKE